MKVMVDNDVRGGDGGAKARITHYVAVLPPESCEAMVGRDPAPWTPGTQVECSNRGGKEEAAVIYEWH